MARLSLSTLIVATIALFLLIGSGSTSARLLVPIWITDATGISIQEEMTESKTKALITSDESLIKEVKALEEAKSVSNNKCFGVGTICIDTRDCCPRLTCEINSGVPRCSRRFGNDVKALEEAKPVSNNKCNGVGSICVDTRDCCPRLTCEILSGVPRCSRRFGNQEIAANN